MGKEVEGRLGSRQLSSVICRTSRATVLGKEGGGETRKGGGNRGKFSGTVNKNQGSDVGRGRRRGREKVQRNLRRG